MSVVQTAEPVNMTFTDNAAAKVKSLIAEEDNYRLKLRVFVTGGGSSGFLYGLSEHFRVGALHVGFAAEGGSQEASGATAATDARTVL